MTKSILFLFTMINIIAIFSLVIVGLGLSETFSGFYLHITSASVAFSQGILIIWQMKLLELLGNMQG